MKLFLPMCLALILLVGFLQTDAEAQIFENHYLIYETFQQIPFSLPVTLTDEFGSGIYTSFLMDHFANPVEKNGEPIVNPEVHETWWQINDPQPPRTVTLNNQFGVQDWVLGDGRYLVLPARKNEPGPPPIWNHYKCYQAEGPLMQIPVNLVDQFGGYDTFVLEPKLYCTPCRKDVPDGEYPIVDPVPRLAVYNLAELPFVPVGIGTFDQFIFGASMADFTPVWLAVPSHRMQEGCFLNCPLGDGGLVGPGSGNKSPDLNSDGFVSLADFSIFAACFSAYDYCCDFDCDGAITIADFAIFASHYQHSGVPGFCS